MINLIDVEKPLREEVEEIRQAVSLIKDIYQMLKNYLCAECTRPDCGACYNCECFTRQTERRE